MTNYCISTILIYTPLDGVYSFWLGMSPRGHLLLKM